MDVVATMKTRSQCLVFSVIETDGTNIAGDRGGLPPDAESLEPSL